MDNTNPILESHQNNIWKSKLKIQYIAEQQIQKSESFFGYTIMWADVIPMLGTEPKDLHQTKEQWYEKVTSMFAARKTFKYLCGLKPVAKELDGSKFPDFGIGTK